MASDLLVSISTLCPFFILFSPYPGKGGMWEWLYGHLEAAMIISTTQLEGSFTEGTEGSFWDQHRELLLCPAPCLNTHNDQGGKLGTGWKQWGWEKLPVLHSNRMWVGRYRNIRRTRGEKKSHGSSLTLEEVDREAVEHSKLDRSWRMWSKVSLPSVSWKLIIFQSGVPLSAQMDLHSFFLNKNSYCFIKIFT